MFPLLPYQHVAINTNLSIDDAASLLANRVSPPPRLFRRSSDTEKEKEYEGKVSQTGFRVNRKINYRNSFLPILYGKFIPTNYGTKVNIHMTMHPIVIVFCCVWCSPLLGALWATVKDMIFSNSPFDSVVFMPIGMLTFLYLMVFFSFGIEAKRSKNFMEKLFEKYNVLE